LSGPDTEVFINRVYDLQDFQAIGLDYWDGNDTNVRAFQERTTISYPLCFSASGTQALYQAYDAKDVSLVIDQQGIVRYRGGGVNILQITAMIDNLLLTNSIEENHSPGKFALFQNYPNPFNPTTIISFNIDTQTKVSLKVYDNQGRFIRTLIENTMHTGKHEVSWDGRNAHGRPVSAGVYFYVIKTADFRQIKKMTFIR
jgi:hypothetical protein